MSYPSPRDDFHRGERILRGYCGECGEINHHNECPQLYTFQAEIAKMFARDVAHGIDIKLWEMMKHDNRSLE